MRNPSLDFHPFSGSARLTKRLLACAALVVACVFSAAPPASAAGEQWIDGNISTASGMSSIPMAGNLYQQQVGAFTGYWGRPDASYPKVGDLYWGRVYYQSLGYGQQLGLHGVQVEINLPAGTQLAIDPAKAAEGMTIRCFGTNTKGQTSNVTDQSWQHPNNSSIRGKFCESAKTYVGPNGTIISYALVGQGQAMEIVFPLRSTKKLSGIAEPNNASRMSAVITDSEADSTANPYQWNFVGDRPVEAECAANGPTVASAITNTTAHTKNSMCNWHRTGKASVELGEASTGGYQVSSQQFNVPANAQGFGIDQDWHSLTPGTTYHWRMKFVDDKGTPNNPNDDQTYYSQPKTFTTTGTRPTTPPPTQPGAGSGGAQTGNGGQAPGGQTPGGNGTTPGGDTGTNNNDQQQNLDQKQDQQQDQQQDQVQDNRDGTAPAVTATLGKAKLRNVLKKGLPASITCSESCSVDAKLQVDAKTAKKLKLGKVATVIGSGKASSPAGGKVDVTVKLNAKAKKALKKAKSLKAKLIVGATDTAGNSASPVTKPVALKR